MWMSDARRWMALKRIESTRRMMGDESAVMRSMERTSSPSSASCTSCMLNPSVASSRTRCVDSDFSRMSPIRFAGPTLTSRGRASTSSTSLSLVTSEGSAITTCSVSPSERNGRNW